MGILKLNNSMYRDIQAYVEIAFVEFSIIFSFLLQKNKKNKKKGFYLHVIACLIRLSRSDVPEV